MTTDGRRGINIGYNFLNLPKEVKDGSLTLGTYTYLADGTKTAVAGSTEELDYLGSLIYKKDGNTRSLNNVLFSEGVINKEGATYNRMYHIRDHLGSVRVVTDNSGANIEQNDYYPFGLRVDTGSQTYNRYKFSGKEIQTMVASNFNYLDFGARHYDPVIARWSTQDPMSEKYYGIGQYVYAANNPINAIDFDGRDYRLIKNDRKNTITVKATYYTDNSSKKSAEQAVSIINNITDNTYTDSKGTKYAIVFDLDVYDVGEVNINNRAKSSSSSNSYILSEQVYNETADNKEVAGITRENKYIKVSKKYGAETTGAHEIGHSLNMKHDYAGLMTERSSDEGRSKSFTQQNINDMVDNYNRKTLWDQIKSIFSIE